MTARFVIDFNEGTEDEASTVAESIEIGTAIQNAWRTLYPDLNVRERLLKEGVTVTLQRLDG